MHSVHVLALHNIALWKMMIKNESDWQAYVKALADAGFELQCHFTSEDGTGERI
jgi:hypothetical protein